MGLLYSTNPKSGSRFSGWWIKKRFIPEKCETRAFRVYMPDNAHSSADARFSVTKRQAPTPPLRPRRSRRSGLAVLVSFSMLAGALALAVIVMIGRPVAAPDWLRTRIEARIAQNLPGVDLSFGRMSLLLQSSGLARIILWDVEITNKQGALIAQLSDLEAGLSPAALLRGKLELREAQLSGAFVTLRRNEAGQIGLALGDAFSAGGTMPDLGTIITRLDTLLEDPRLARLDLIETDALTLRFEDLRARRGWTADGGRLSLERGRDDILRLSGDVALLSGGAGVSTIEVNAQSRIGESAMTFGLSLRDFPARDIASQSPALAWLDDLDAPISGALRSGFRDDGTLDVLNATLTIGSGVLQPNSETQPLRFDGARTYFTYDPTQGLLSFDEIAVSAPRGALSARGQARLDGLEQGWPSGIAGQFTLSNMRLAEGMVLDQALTLSKAQLAFRLDLANFGLDVGELTVLDPQFPIRAKGWLHAREDGWHGALDATVARADSQQVKTYWPERLTPRTRQWVVNNVHSGEVSEAIFALRLRPDERPETFVDFRVTDAEISYNDFLPRLRAGSGRITIYDHRLGVQLDQGHVDPGQGGLIDLAGSQFVIPDLRRKPAQAEIRLKAKGSVTSALSYLDNERWQLLHRAGLDVGLAKGEARLEGKIVLELRAGLTLDDIALDLRARLQQVQSDTLVPGHVLRASELALHMDNSAVEISGAANLSGVTARGSWRKLFKGDAGTITAQVDITPQNLSKLGITLPDGMVSGAGKGALMLDLGQNGGPGFTLTSDLHGIGLSISQLGWRLARQERGSFRISGSLGEDISVDSLSLSAGGLEAQGDLTLRPKSEGGGLDNLSLSQLKLGTWLDVSGALRGRGARAPLIEIERGRVDLRYAGFGGGNGGGGDGSPLSLVLDELRVTDSIIIRGFRGDFNSANGGLSGRFNGMLGGKARIEGLTSVQNGGTAIRVTGRDAGDILKQAGMLKTVRDGTFRLDMVPVAGQAGTYDGSMRIEGTRLRNAPAIGDLLDAISIVGLIDQLNGPGIFFAEVLANFRLTPSRVIVTQSSAVGPSMGISLDGYYDLASGRMDMQGVLSPIYFVNAIGQIFSRRGEGLIGFNFALRGTVDKPAVSVNPLSIFTPGMFREIFRRPAPKVSR